MTRRAAIVLLVLVVAASDSAAVAGPSSLVRLRVLRFVDDSRRAQFRDGTSSPRLLVTYVRYPARGHGPFPLIVFCHGFALTPQTYSLLLDTWARAGYVVAAPAFPVENAHARGGPDQSDLSNEPGDISFVVSRLTASTDPLQALIDPMRIAVAGQSDGGVAALAAAFDQRFRDRRIRAAAILSGAAPGGFTRPGRGPPPLLAVQGTSDPINSPDSTASYFRIMRRPKFLLWLLGASHLPPYTTGDRGAAVVDRASTAFFDHYLRGAPLGRLIAVGTRRGVTRLTASP